MSYNYDFRQIWKKAREVAFGNGSCSHPQAIDVAATHQHNAPCPTRYALLGAPIRQRYPDSPDWINAEKMPSIATGILPKQYRDMHTIKTRPNCDWADKVREAFGECNVQDISGPENIYLAVEIARCTAEKLATEKFAESRGMGLEQLSYITKNGQVVADIKLNGLGGICGSVYGEQVSAWVDATCKARNLTPLQAISTINLLIDAKIPYILHQRTTKLSAETNPRHGFIDKTPKFFEINGQNVPIHKKAYVYGNAGQVISAILWYRSDQYSFCLAAPIGKGVMNIGVYQPPAHYLNQHNFWKYPEATVILCPDMRTALAIEEKLSEIPGYSPREFFVVSHLGTHLNTLNWDHFWGRNVVFIPGPTPYCLSMVRSYENFIKGAGARNVSVHPGFLLHDCQGPRNSMSEDNTASGIFSFEYVDCVDSMLLHIRKIIYNAIPVEDFIQQGQTLGIFQAKAQEQAPSPTKDSQLLATSTLSEILERGYKDLSSLYMEFVFGTLTMLYGISNIGKSRVLAILALVLASGGSFLGLQAQKKHKVAYYNAEYGEEGAANDLRIAGANKMPNLDATLSVIHNSGDRPVAEQIFESVKRLGSDYLIFDTPQVAFSKMANGQTKDLFELVKRLNSIGCKVIFSHHTGKDSESHLGSQNLVNLTPTVIRIDEGTYSKDEVNEMVAAGKVSNDYINATLIVEKWKNGAARPTIEFETEQGEWSLISGEWCLGRQAKPAQIFPNSKSESEPRCVTYDAPAAQVSALLAEVDKNADADDASIPLPEVSNADLTGDEQIVLKMAIQNGKISTGFVRKDLFCEATKALEILNSLVAKGILKRRGQGRGTHYIPVYENNLS